MERGLNTDAALLAPDCVQALIDQGRIPQLMKVPGKKPQILFFVPSQNPQDFSGEKDSDFVTMYSLPLKEGRKIQRRIWEILRAQGLDKSGDLSFVFKKLRVWFSDNLCDLLTSDVM